MLPCWRSNTSRILPQCTNGEEARPALQWTGGEDGGRYRKGRNLCLDLCAGPQLPLWFDRGRAWSVQTRATA